ncbi:VOC family protein [Natronolimnobius baerhuensis]|uniref:Lactoylglutathione lyase n=1 Tax=Natronolimnobius baerhuensis TaxID=253108 RepID=A0A202E801_9EURY|nr:VOC family protein [Natronolimnobius baerhuensis]OVE84392.1 lactoylglutathione lyase [Natronolimnobius baerhuensis]
MSTQSLTAHHVGLTVADLEAVLPFYQDVLGFELAGEFEVSGEAFSDAVDVADAAGTFVHLDGHGVRIELVEYEPEGEEISSVQLNQPGGMHFGFTVDDLEAFYEDLPADAETLSEPQTTATGNSILFVRDPEENLVEVLEISE